MPPPRDVKKTESLNDEDKRVLANRYRVEKKLGSGNFGTAFVVTDLKENDELKVLKEISIGDMEPDESIESVQEANLLSKLDNPYILKYHDSFLDGEYFCIVTEYCEGGDLDVRFKKLKKENKTLSEEQVLDWTVQLLSAVNYMHSRRVLHRDLKARNEVIKIGDFGISRILQGTMDMASTFTGTPYYMSPEVLKHEGYNSKSDVWSIGCLLYEMHAFEGQGLMGVMYKIVEGKTPQLPKTYSVELNNILKKIFRKDPAARPSTSELLREPFIANHIKDMIQRFESSKINDLESTVVVRNDRNEIAKAVNSKVLLKDLQIKRQLTTVEERTTSSPTPVNKNSILKATPIIKPVPASVVAAAPVPSHNKLADKEPEYDDDDDVRSGVNQPTSPIVKQKTISSPANNAGKELTPKERLLLNKLKKADEEAAKVGQLAKENYEERILRETFRREATIHSSIPNLSIKLAQKNAEYDNLQNNYELPPLKKSDQEPVGNQTFSHTYKSQPNVVSTTYYPVNSNNQYEYYVENANGEEDEGTILQTIQYLNNQLENQKNQTLTRKTSTIDSRPIKPMGKKLEQILNEDGLPSDPHLTNEYYKNSLNDFEYDSSPERKQQSTSNLTNRSITKNSMSKTVVPANRRRGATAGGLNGGRKPLSILKNAPAPNQDDSKPSTTKNVVVYNSASKTFSSVPRSSVATRVEYEQLIDAMQNHLSNNNPDLTQTFGDDQKNSVFGTQTRLTKIQNLRAQAMRRLGAETFQNVYSYLREQRRGPNSADADENQIFNGLKKFTPNPSDCFLVDQLLFLEET